MAPGAVPIRVGGVSLAVAAWDRRDGEARRAATQRESGSRGARFPAARGAFSSGGVSWRRGDLAGDD